MDDDFKNPFDQSEIDKIQKEIDRDLNQSEIGAINNNLQNSSLSEPAPPPLVGTREIAFEENINEACQIPTEINTNNFYRETIKREAHKSSKGKFAKIIALVCLISILGGSAIGVMFSVSNEVIIPFFKDGSATTKNNEVPSKDFSFPVIEDSTKTESITKGNGTKTETSYSDYMSFADLIDSVEPSVVRITSVVEGQFDYGFFPIQGEVPSQGSGIIFDQDDKNVYIVSNNHVTTTAKSVQVSVAGSENVEAKFVGKEAQSDLVVLSVSKSDLKEKGIEQVTVAKFGSSKDMRVGDFAIAIGNALGEGNTATFGFISAINKELNVEDRVLNVIQTDAAINPGNSGGPLINLNGEVIGINTLKLSETSVEGMGYSITSDVAMPIIEQLRNQTPKPVLGIVGATVTEQIAKAFKLPQMGVVVDSVIEGSSASKVGIKRTDIITSFKNEPVFTMEQLSESVKGCKVGEKVEVVVIRQGVLEPITFEVTLTEMTDDNF